MVRLWPSLRVVGIDRSAAALAIARERLRGSALAERIELREQSAEQLSDREAFDLAWIPSVFIPAAALDVVLARVHDALRSGGFLLVPVMRADGADLEAALAGLRTAMFGGSAHAPDSVERRLLAAGFREVRVLPSARVTTTVMVVGRKRDAGAAPVS
jgi:SAM-dependent methyltransferase